MDKLMTVQELADYLNVTVKTIYRLLVYGSLPAKRVGHLWRFERASIDTWLRQHTKTVTAHILVIDDDIRVSSLLQEALQETGYMVDTVNNSIKGVEMIKNGNYDLVFIDIVMSGINGTEVFEQIKSAKPELPVTIMTGHTDSEFIISAMERGSFGIMKKPLTESEIATAVNNYLRFRMA